jgi:hypothetical protein
MLLTDVISQIGDLLPAGLWWALAALAFVVGCIFGARAS